MKRKTFIKRVQALGIQRNDAQIVAETFRIFRLPYAAALPEFIAAYNRRRQS